MGSENFRNEFMNKHKRQTDRLKRRVIEDRKKPIWEWMPGIENADPKIRKAYDEAQAEEQEEWRRRNLRNVAKQQGITVEELERVLREGRSGSVFPSSEKE